jgi:hypothetical protein
MEPRALNERRRDMRSVLAIAALIGSFLLSGCGQVTADAAASPPASPDGTRWVGSGQVVTVSGPPFDTGR